jgi:hypothetical protein
MINFEDSTHLLLALAQQFDRYAERNERYLQTASAKAWREAADILRDTVLTHTNSSQSKTYKETQKMSDSEYRVCSLSALAVRFDYYAEMADQDLDDALAEGRDTASQCVAIAETWREAANILRRTVLTHTNASQSKTFKETQK